MKDGSGVSAAITESVVVSSYVEAHAFTLCTHIGTLLEQYWVGTWA